MCQGVFCKAPLSKKVKDDKLETLYFYQAAPSLLRSRIIYKKSLLAESLKEKVNISYGKKTLKIAIQQGSNSLGAIDAKSAVASKTAPLKPARTRASASNTAATAPVAAVKTTDLRPTIKPKGDLNLSSFSTKSFFFLGILALALAGLLIYFKRRGFSDQQNLDFRVISQYPIGPKKTLMLVEFENEKLLLGVTDHSISLVKNLGESSHVKSNTKEFLKTEEEISL